ncbi:MAG: hypothetical protein CMP11_05140 [Zetaproteobacteria bacterium]|nr:hypothetical protein [Pseudobdellovibrionaceae bacterium]
MELRTLFINIWSIFITSFLVLLKFFSFFSLSLRKKILKRELTNKMLQELSRERAKVETCFIFFCSSAGELEQALPIIQEYKEDPKVMILVIFFSESGLIYNATQDYKINHILSPFDTLTNWKKIIYATDPTVTVVVRHELWPCFLHLASKHSKLLLINASSPSGTKGSYLKKKIKTFLYSFFDKICLVSSLDLKFFLKNFAIQEKNLTVTSDTKYDKAIKNIAQKSKAFLAWEQEWKLTHDSKKKTLIVGSAWEEDIFNILEAVDHLQDQFFEKFQIIIVPHEPTKKLVKHTEKLCFRKGLRSKVFPSEKGSGNEKNKIIIVGILGILKDLYRYADMVFVGGAFHYQVHNVLEPAAFGVPTAFGPLYKNSREAIELVSSGKSCVTINPVEIAKWWQASSKVNKQDSKNIEKHLLNFLGAKQKVMHEIDGFLTSNK